MKDTKEITFRLALREEITQVADLRWRLKKEDADFFDIAEREAFVAAFAQEQARSTAFSHWVADAGGRLVAVMSVGRVAKLPAPDKLAGYWGYLTNCYSLPGYRGRGIGTGLLAAVTSWAKEQELELLVVWPSDRSYSFLRKGRLSETSRPFGVGPRNLRPH